MIEEELKIYFFVIVLFLFQVDNVKLVDYATSVRGVIGTLHLTTTHVIFVDPNGAKETWVIHK